MEKYFPEFERYNKEVEFAALIQRSKTVQEYMVQFKILVRFAPHLVDTQVKKNQKYVMGLNTTF